MKLFAAIDGGGTKTRCIIGDENGNIFGDYTGAASNHQLVGKERAAASIEECFVHTLKGAGFTKEEMHFIYLGLSGADLPSDFEILKDICKPIFDPVLFEIVNDTWISLRSGLNDTWGAVSICGTGANAAARHPDGKNFILPSISYELGNYGGGGHLTEKALHRAFRANEGTGSSTLLQEYLPIALKVQSMDELFSRFYPKRIITQEELLKVPPLVFELASKRDNVCQELLIEMGNVLGEMVAGVIQRVGMEDMEVPVVLGGSLYKGSNPLLVDQLTITLHRTAPKAFVKLPTLPPVAGAYLSALDLMNIKVNSDVYEKLNMSLK
ncbi:MAG: ATPase [Clostridia bacterium]|nr:ATPase [Clostridia bacterium]